MPEITLHPLSPLGDVCLPVADLAGLLAGGHPGCVLDTRLAETLACRPPVWIGHSEAEQRFFFGGKSPDAFALDYPFLPAYLAALPQARLVGQAHIVIAGDNRVLTDSYSGDHVLQLDGRFQQRTLRVDLDGRSLRLPIALYRSPGRPRVIPERCLLPTHYWHFNYHHWLIECLPRLRHVLETEEFADCRVIVPGGMSAFQRESLALLGLPAERQLPFDGGDWQIQTLLFPSIGSFAPAELEWLRRRLRANQPAGASESLGLESPAGKPTRLYISRTDATQRRLANEAEIIATLQPYGFEILTLTGMPLAEQIRRFAQAEIIVGPHGSGLTNVLFAPRQATLIELMPHDRVNHCFWLMTNVLGQPYTFLAGRIVSPERDFVVDTQRLAAMVGTVLA
jgi:hypothetical protein